MSYNTRTIPLLKTNKRTVNDAKMLWLLQGCQRKRRTTCAQGFLAELMRVVLTTNLPWLGPNPSPVVAINVRMSLLATTSPMNEGASWYFRYTTRKYILYLSLPQLNSTTNLHLNWCVINTPNIPPTTTASYAAPRSTTQHHMTSNKIM